MIRRCVGVGLVVLAACGGAETREPAAASEPAPVASASAAPKRALRKARPFAKCVTPATPVSTEAGDAGVSGVSDADAVIVTLRPDFKRCYSAGLEIDELLQGCVIITAQVAPAGEVASAETASREGLTPSVAACLRDVVKKAHFNAPGGKGSTLQIPITFINEGSAR